MRPELTLLLWSVALTFAQAMLAVCGGIEQVGLPRLAGNRDNLPVFAGWAGRAQRAHRNMLESLVLFACVVLIAVIAGRTDRITLLGAQLFFWARLAYAVIYLIGIPWLRTLVWGVAVAGIVMIVLQGI